MLGQLTGAGGAFPSLVWYRRRKGATPSKPTDLDARSIDGGGRSLPLPGAIGAGGAFPSLVRGCAIKLTGGRTRLCLSRSFSGLATMRGTCRN